MEPGYPDEFPQELIPLRPVIADRRPTLDLVRIIPLQLLLISTAALNLGFVIDRWVHGRQRKLNLPIRQRSMQYSSK